MPLRILSVIVLYKTAIQDCVALQTLQSARRETSASDLEVKILLFDNTPGATHPSDLPTDVQYELAARNGGLAAAYNRALDVAVSEGREWLITLDQDSRLPCNYLSRMGAIARLFNDDSSVAAVVPQLTDHERLLSPVAVGRVGVSPLPRGFTGFFPRETHAYNSGSMLRVSALTQLGGFSRLFWLDYLDAWLFTHLALLGQRVFVAGDLQIEHELSVLDVGSRLNCSRFQNYLSAESAYVDQYKGWLEAWWLNARLVARWLRNGRRGANVALQKATLLCLKGRLFSTRKQRIIEWKRDMERLNAELNNPADR